jgi:hypothetical protein
MRSLAMAAALLAAPAFADDFVARSGKDVLRLTQQPCHEKVVQLIEQRPDLAAFATIDGKTYLGCWALRADGRVLIRYEDGDAGLIPLTDFEPEKGV